MVGTEDLMPISEQEKHERQIAVGSVLGTNAMEGIFPDPTTADLLERYGTGELSMDQFSSAMDRHAEQRVKAQRQVAGAA